ncbi:MAG: hypothetical protein BHW56_06610 [Acetobacter sp. 46_36]|nr:MAG: hypothetical protein BHW56_06610 [Acetobacter sp. 46_36]
MLRLALLPGFWRKSSASGWAPSISGSLLWDNLGVKTGVDKGKIGIMQCFLGRMSFGEKKRRGGSAAGENRDKRRRIRQR